MKRSLLLFIFVGLIGLQSCEGPEGPEGIPGRDGLIGSEVFEVETSFNESNKFSDTFSFSAPIDKSDNVLVYRLSGSDNGLDVWRLLPQTHYFEGGAEIDYNFDFTYKDFRVFLSTTMNNVNSFEGGSWTNNQIFRAIVIKGFSPDQRKSYSKDDESLDYETVIKKYNLENAPIKRLKAK